MKLLIFLFLTVYSVWSLQIGDDCNLSSSRGRCTLLKNCPTAISNLKQNIYPEICGYQDLESIVCCSEKPNVSIYVETESKSDNSNRISKQKCIEYGRSVYETKTVLWMGGMKHENVSTCVTDNFLISGIYAKAKEFPHMALLGFGPEDDKQWKCSGTLISEKFVLTVAHCTVDRQLGYVKWVRLGDLDFESPNDDSDFIDFTIISVHRHPQYHYQVYYNDIALLELERDVPFSSYIRPACLYTGNDHTLDKFILSGWALFSSDSINVGHLRRVKNIKLVGNEECNKEYSRHISRKLKNGIDKNTMICSEEGPIDSCKISSGAPLQVHSEDVYCMFEVVGISSFGKLGCTNSSVVYTKIPGYIDWIESIVWPPKM